MLNEELKHINNNFVSTADGSNFLLYVQNMRREVLSSLPKKEKLTKICWEEKLSPVVVADYDE